MLTLIVGWCDRAERKTSTGADKDALPSNVKIVNGNGKHVTPARHSPPNPGVNLNKISASKYTTTCLCACLQRRATRPAVADIYLGAPC